jgi:leader peptidase (prepilin peptidase) / N-methyltransferase
MLPLVLTLLFMAGALVGAMINCCADRLPYEKSLLWPASRCTSCLRRIRWYEQIPLLSYCFLRGRCRSCGVSLPLRYLLVELFTAAAFVGLFYLEIMANALKIPLLKDQHQAILAGNVCLQAWSVFGYHALLMSLLILVSVCDLEHLEIPLGVTITGTLLGLAGSMVFPWPYPLDQGPGPGVMPSGLYPWPVWNDLPPWLPPGSWQLGLATGLAGAAAGMMVLRGVRFLFGLGRGLEGMGLGDADLMMMAGSFVGWQPVLVAFFAGVIPALGFAVVQLVRKGDHPLPFGPSLAIGVMLTLFAWPAISEPFRPLFFQGWILGSMFVLGAVFLLFTSFVLRLVRGTGTS